MIILLSQVNILLPIFFIVVCGVLVCLPIYDQPKVPSFSLKNKSRIHDDARPCSRCDRHMFRDVDEGRGWLLFPILIIVKDTGSSLNIVFFWKILKYSGLLHFSVFPRWCQCVYTHQAGRTPALQQNWQSLEKSPNFKEKHNI